MTSLVSASQVVTGQVQSLDSVRAHALPSDAMIFASGTKVQPANQNLGSYAIVESAGATALTNNVVAAVTQSPFADLYKEGSMYFPGSTASNIFCTTGYYAIGSGLTGECWLYPPSFTGSVVNIGGSPTNILMPCALGAIGPGSSATAWSIGTNTTGNVVFYYYSSGGQSVTSITQLSANTWNHIAATISSGNIFLFINGVQTQVSANRGGTLQAAAYYEPVQGTPGSYGYAGVGATGTAYTTGYIADARIVSGAAVYTGSTGSYATFTVPSAPLGIAASGTTQFLLRAGQNSPTVQNGALTFDRGLKQYMNFGPQTFNIATRGFSIVFRYTWNGTLTGYERIFQATTTTANQNNSLLIARYSGTNSLYGAYYIGGSAITFATSATTISQGTNYVAAFVYNPSTGTGQCWINGAPSGSAVTSLASSITTDLLTPFTFVGCDYAGTGSFTSMTSNTLAIYNRALSNVEIYNSYLALTTNTVNAPIEIGDANGTPALSIAGDGRVNVTKLGQSSNVLPWPPAAMSGYVTSINGGTYVASASTDGYNACWQAFDKSQGTSSVGFWQCGPPNTLYTSSSPYSYTGSVTTTDINGTVYPGEWIQIQMPTSVVISSYSIAPQVNAPTLAPTGWNVLGSRDGVNWTLLNSQSYSGWQAGVYSSFITNVTQSYSYFRMSCQRTGGSGGTVNIAEWTLFGTADTAQPLTIAQPVTLSYGAQTASLTGIANAGVFVPQDFSSSGLNIPAYVVSNTATTANTVAFSSFGPFAGEGSLYFPGGTGAQGAFVYFPPSTVPQLNFPLNGATCTIEFWFFPTKPGGAQTMVSHAPFVASSGYDWTFYIGTDNKIGFYAPAGGNPTSAATVNYGAWNHAAVSFTGGNVYLSLNGAITSAASTPGFTSTHVFVIGQERAVAATYTYSGYISNFRVVQGAALYTTNFTPSTQPLTAIQGVTQAGLPYGTVLLLRNAPAPGRVLTSKFGGANSGGVLAFPPAAMTTYATTLNSGYGQGTYVASASSEQSGEVAWCAFDKSTSTFWRSPTSYGGSAPYVYPGSVRTVDISGNSYAGEWCQIQLPSSIVLSNYVIYGIGGNMPIVWYVLGSRDGTSWNLVDQRNFNSWSGYTTFTVSTSQAFTHYRIVLNTSNGSTAALYEWILNGTIEGLALTQDGRLGVGVSAPVQALEVAGSAVVAGTLSAGNPLMFRNRIINGDMRIWQRGTSFTASANTYTADRWVTPTNSVTTITATQSTNVPFRAGFQYSLSLATATTANNPLIEYRIEQFGVADLYQGTPITISFWMRQTVGSSIPMNIEPLFPATINAFGTGLADACTPLFQQIIPSSNWQYYTLTFCIAVTGVATNGLSVQFWQQPSANPSTVLITGVQLEKGSVATPFEVRPYATELALCQRYYHRTCNAGTVPLLCPLTIITSTTAEGVYKLPVTMRIVPALATSGTATLDWHAVSNNSVGGLSILTASGQSTIDNAVIIASTVGNGSAGSVTVGQTRMLMINTGFIDFSAEL